MKKKLLTCFIISALTLMTACGAANKKNEKVITPVPKVEVKPVETKTETKVLAPEVKPVRNETPKVEKLEPKTEEKTTEKPNIIILVVSKEEAADIIKSILPNGNVEIKGLKTETLDTKKENKTENIVKTEITEPKIITEEKKEIAVVTPVVLEKETPKVEKKELPTVVTVEKPVVLEEKKELTKTEVSAVDKNSDTDKDGVPDYLDSYPNEVLKTTLLSQGIQKVVITDTMKETDTILTAQMAEELDKIAAIMKKDKSLKIKIVAHTNNIGNETVNLKLSEKRALLAETYLNSKGVPLDYVATAWKGGSEPMVNNDTKENRAKNKRLEVIFYIVNIKAKK